MEQIYFDKKLRTVAPKSSSIYYSWELMPSSQNGLKSSLFRDRHGIPSYVLLNLVNSVSADDFSIYGKEVGVAKSKVNFTHVTNRSR